MVEQFSIDEWITNTLNVRLIDVRTPKEYEKFHIPGAINIPLFSNEERAEVGTLYKQFSPQAAIDRGLELVSPKLPQIYKDVRELKTSEKEKDLVIYCWRGGMRSRSLVSFLSMMGLSSKQLTGGIRSFRKRIVADLENFALEEKPFYVLEGLTGTRKTDILLKLQEEGYPVLDLEGLANHRGSIFGSIGKREISQKAFEKDLWLRLRELKDAQAPYYLIEGESRRLGRIMLPDFIVEGKEKGTRFVTQYPFQKRVEAIYKEYMPHLYRDQLHDAFEHLKRFMSVTLIEEIESAFLAENDRLVIQLLLEHHYDTKYEHSHAANEGEKIVISFETLEEGVLKVKKELERLLSLEDVKAKEGVGAKEDFGSKDLASKDHLDSKEVLGSKADPLSKVASGYSKRLSATE